MSVPVAGTNVLVIGTGGAGLRAAIAAHQAGAEVLVLGKRGRSDAHTVLAAGGINAALGTVDPQDSWHQHFADTLQEGYLLGHPRVAEIMTSEAPEMVKELDEWGCEFARTEDGRLDQRFFGAHRWRRTCYAGDYIGKAIIDTLIRKIDELGIRILEHRCVSSLLVDDGRCFGALAFDLRTGQRTAFVSDAVILATGGHASLWQRNTSRAGENHGEGMALALLAGCRLMDMEMVQFHPTGLVWPPDVAGTLVTEAVRGEGGLLTNAGGERFMARYDPARMELSTRDRVALANYTEIIEGRAGPHGGVFLDVSHRGKDYILERLPKLYRQLQSFEGLDISKEPMEVAPTAHYSMGGIAVEPETHATDVDGLFAAGECASGLHGANRLGGNSLVDILVFGRRAGETAAARRSARPDETVAGRVADRAAAEFDALGANAGSALDRLMALRLTIWERCGVVRDDPSLRGCLERLQELRAGAPGEGAVRPTDLAEALNLQAGLLTSEATVRSALERRETRGCHNRSDFPELDPSLGVNLFSRVDPSTGELAVSSQPVPSMTADQAEWLRLGMREGGEDE